MKLATALAVASSMFVSVVSFGQAAQADTVKISKLSCVGLNGVKIKSRRDSALIDTQYGWFKQTFETNGQATVDENNKTIKISLGYKGRPDLVAYDIYLAGVPALDEATTVEGVVGTTQYAPVVPLPIVAPVPVPVNFFPVTTLTCKVLLAELN